MEGRKEQWRKEKPNMLDNVLRILEPVIVLQMTLLPRRYIRFGQPSVDF